MPTTPTKAENPLVFPQSVHPDAPFGGMPLRDYFAVKLAAAALSTHGIWYSNSAEIAYRQADDLLAQRSKQP